MDNTPIYTSFDLGRIVEFNTIFPRCAMPKISKCLRGFRRDQMFGGLLSNLVNKVVNKPFYNPNYRGDEKDIDALRFFLSGENIDLIKKSIDSLYQIAQKERQDISHYLGATEESALYLAREIMATEDADDSRSRGKVEKEFLKALLAANTITLQKGRSKGKRDTDDLEMYLAETFVSQFGSVDFLYPNRQLLITSQTVKCIRFFEYATQDPFLSPLVQDFCNYYGIKEWWIYPKALWSVFGITRGKAGIINVGNIAMKEAAQYISVIDKSSIPCSKIIPKNENVDYTAFRAKPLVKIAENEYVVFNFQLLRSGEFQKRWDEECPRDAVVCPVLVAPEVKFTTQGVKNLLQRWQNESGISMDNVKPVAFTDLGTLCLFQHEFANKTILSYLEDYYMQSDFSNFEKSNDFNDVPNVLMSFSDYLCHTHNNTLSKFGDEWAEYIKRGE